MPSISSIHHISVTVTDIERSVPWYSQVLRSMSVTVMDT